MIELIILLLLSIIFITILASQILVPPQLYEDVIIPGVGFGSGKIQRGCAIYQTYTIDTATVDQLQSYPNVTGLCIEGTIRALEKVSLACERTIGCTEPSTGMTVGLGEYATYYRPCGNLPFCGNLSVNILYQGRCVNLQTGTVRSVSNCPLEDSYVLEEGRFRIPTSLTCLAQTLNFVPCNSTTAAVWVYQDNYISSGNIFLAVNGNLLTTVTSQAQASKFTIAYSFRG